MEVNFLLYSDLLPGLSQLGGPRLSEIASSAGIPLKDIQPENIEGIAKAIVVHIEKFDDLKVLLTSADFDIIGPKLNLGPRAKWKRPFIEYDHAVYLDLISKNPFGAVRPVRATSRDASNAGGWTELASLKVWSKLAASQKTKVARSLARALGEDFTFVDLVNPHQLALIQDTKIKLGFIAIPGGKYLRGLTDDEKKELARIARKHGNEEARLFARDISETARPAHEVNLPPFLCAQAPLSGAQGRKFTKSAQLLDGNHKVYRYKGVDAMALTRQSHARLITEAEWEYIARAGGKQTWLSGKEDPQEYASRALSAKLLESEDHPFGVYGLGWGTWVEDGWRLSYRGVHTDGSAWEPREIPYVMRSGAFQSFPWQTPGEEFMLHAAYRERMMDKEAAVLLAKDLPKRKK